MEDLPKVEVEKAMPRDAKILRNIIYDMNEADKLYRGILEKYSIKSFKELTIKQRVEIIQDLNIT